MNKLHLQVERDFRYLHHVTRHDPRAPTRSRWFTSSSSRRASIFLLFTLSYSFFATSFPFYFLIIVSSLTRSFSHSTNLVTIAGSIGICRTCEPTTIMYKISSIKMLHVLQFTLEHLLFWHLNTCMFKSKYLNWNYTVLK